MITKFTIDVSSLRQKKAKAIEALTSLQLQVNALQEEVNALSHAERVLVSIGVPVDDVTVTNDLQSSNSKDFNVLSKGQLVLHTGGSNLAVRVNPLSSIGRSPSNKKTIYMVMQKGGTLRREDIVKQVIGLKPDANPLTVGVEISRMSKPDGELLSLGKGIYQLKT